MTTDCADLVQRQPRELVINFLTALDHSQEVRLPVTFHWVAKTQEVLDKKSDKLRRRSPTTKHDHQSARERVDFPLLLTQQLFTNGEGHTGMR